MRIPTKPFIIPKSPTIRNFLACKAIEVLVSGPRNCAKSFTILRYILALHEMHDNFQSLMVRHEMKSMGHVYSQLNDKILKYRLDDKRNPFAFKNSSKEEPRPHILFDNGGKMCFAGMDNSDKALGGEQDLVFYNQGEQETKEKHIADLLGCMEGGRAGNWKTRSGLRYQLIVDANPSTPLHFLLHRVEQAKSMTRFDFKHKDHPLFFCWDRMRWSKKGIETRKGLIRAYPEGYLRDRMVDGLWAGAVGMVYPQFNRKDHVTPIRRDDISVDAKWRYSCDWGGINAVGLYADNYNAKHVMFKEIYRKGESVQDILARMNALESRYNIPKISQCFVDHEIDNRFQVRKAGYPYTLAPKREKVGCIEDVKYALTNNLIVFNENSLDDPDDALIGEKQRYTDEVVSLAYKPDDKKTGSKNDDLPAPKQADHACDHVQYYTVGCVVKRKKPELYHAKISVPSRIGLN